MRSIINDLKSKLTTFLFQARARAINAYRISVITKRPDYKKALTIYQRWAKYDQLRDKAAADLDALGWSLRPYWAIGDDDTEPIHVWPTRFLKGALLDHLPEAEERKLEQLSRTYEDAILAIEVAFATKDARLKALIANLYKELR